MQENKLPPTMRVAVELTFVRDCAECRAVAESTAVATIHDASVTGLRLVPGAKHACGADDKSGVPRAAGKLSDAATGPLEGQNQLFTPIPQSDVNGFDPQGRTQ